jgi:hypothetical protein
MLPINRTPRDHANSLIKATYEAEKTIKTVDLQRNKGSSISNWLTNEFNLSGVGSLDGLELERALQLCVLGKLISSADEGQTPSTRSKDVNEHVRGIFFEIEAILLVDIGLTGKWIDRIQGDRFRLSLLRSIVEAGIEDDSDEVCITPEKGSTDSINTFVDFTDFGDKNILFKPRGSAPNSKHKVNKQHYWNQIMQDNPTALLAFYDALDSTYNRIEAQNVEVIDDFIEEFSVLLKKYTIRRTEMLIN